MAEWYQKIQFSSRGEHDSNWIRNHLPETIFLATREIGIAVRMVLANISSPSSCHYSSVIPLECLLHLSSWKAGMYCPGEKMNFWSKYSPCPEEMHVGMFPPFPSACALLCLSPVWWARGEVTPQSRSILPCCVLPLGCGDGIQVVPRVQMLVTAIRAEATGFVLYREEEGERQSRSGCTGRLELGKSWVPSFTREL